VFGGHPWGALLGKEGFFEGLLKRPRIFPRGEFLHPCSEWLGPLRGGGPFGVFFIEKTPFWEEAPQAGVLYRGRENVYSSPPLGGGGENRRRLLKIRGGRLVIKKPPNEGGSPLCPGHTKYVGGFIPPTHKDAHP